MVVYNETRGLPVATRARLAKTFWRRFRGLMGWTSLDVGEGLIIDPCNGVHTGFMRFPIDVFHVAEDGRVLRVLRNMRPWRLGPVVRGSRYVVETAAGTALATGTHEGDILALE